MAATTWDPSHTAAAITLSNGNKTGTTTSTGSLSTHSTNAYAGNSGYLLYFEVTATTVLTAGNTWGVGICSTGSPTGSFPGGSAVAGMGFYQNGKTFVATALQSTYFTFVSGDVIGVAVDFGNEKIWFTKNGTTWNNDVIGNQNPATNTGGFRPAAWGTPGTGNGANPFVTSGVFNNVVINWGSTGSNGNVGILNGGSSAFSYTLPLGYSAWDSPPTAHAGNAYAIMLS